MVHIKIDDCNTLQPMHFECMTCGNTNIIEEAETHRGIFFAMVAGWTYGTEGIFDFAFHDQVNRMATRTSSTKCGLPGMRVHCSVRIEMNYTMFRRGALDAFQMRSRMHAQQLFKGCQWGIVINKVGIKPLRDEVIADSGQTLRAFRVMRTHVMQLAVAVGNKGSGRHLLSLCKPAHSAALE